MKKVEGGFRLDVKARYFWEDMPFGLVVCRFISFDLSIFIALLISCVHLWHLIRGVAELCEVRTPVIDGLIFV
jgi:hypothetical protein